MTEITPLFFCVAAFAVFFVALAKAGFGGMIGSLGMPLVAAVSDIPTAIAVLLPTYIMMDVIVAIIYRKAVDFRLLWPMALWGVAGVYLAAVVFDRINPDGLAIMLGAMSLLLGLKFFRNRLGGQSRSTPIADTGKPQWYRTIALTGGSGFTSFFLMGEAPVQAFLLPYRLMPQVYVAVLVWFFFIVNFVKIPIVLSMGLVTRDSLWISLLLLPIMPLGIAVGKYIATRIAKDPFYIIVHLLLIVLGSYLIASSAWTLSVGA
ncbi:sulfite exporter TauE/SafE family protein [Yoonia sp.]|jgi:uncharacterized protein|uniref:sulfite exporter TauE/SafE family protein n=1 Tax=Yoonia sp. TaxID=2212373 RepID=UPI00404844CE